MSKSLERLIGIEREIRRGSYPNVRTLCEKFEVKPRTIYEDIRNLKEKFNLDIAFDRFKDGYYLRDKDRKLPLFDLNESELTSLALSTKIATNHAGFIKNDLASAMEKIGERVAEGVGKNALGTLEQMHSAYVPHPTIKQKTFSDLKAAIKRQNSIELSYYAASTDETTTREVEPYKLLQHQGTWYLLAFCTMRQDLRLFAIHRIVDLKTHRERRFERNRDLDIERWLNSAFQIEREKNDKEWKVVIFFRKEAAPYIREKIWQAGQKLEEKKDGSLVLTFSTLSLPEVKRWVLYYGANAVVLSPKPLVDMIEAELMSALKNYGAQKSVGLETEQGMHFEDSLDKSTKLA